MDDMNVLSADSRQDDPPAGPVALNWANYSLLGDISEK
jgi:hypothetical protein